MYMHVRGMLAVSKWQPREKERTASALSTISRALLLYPLSLSVGLDAYYIQTMQCNIMGYVYVIFVACPVPLNKGSFLRYTCEQGSHGPVYKESEPCYVLDVIDIIEQCTQAVRQCAQSDA